MVRVQIRLHAGIGYVTPDDEHLVQLVGRTLLAAGQVLEVQVCAALDGGPGWAAGWRSQQDLQR